MYSKTIAINHIIGYIVYTHALIGLKLCAVYEVKDYFVFVLDSGFLLVINSALKLHQ
jgi:hypothetical protein